MRKGWHKSPAMSRPKELGQISTNIIINDTSTKYYHGGGSCTSSEYIFYGLRRCYQTWHFRISMFIDKRSKTLEMIKTSTIHRQHGDIIICFPNIIITKIGSHHQHQATSSTYPIIEKIFIESYYKGNHDLLNHTLVQGFTELVAYHHHKVLKKSRARGKNLFVLRYWPPQTINTCLSTLYLIPGILDEIGQPSHSNFLMTTLLPKIDERVSLLRRS